MEQATGDTAEQVPAEGCRYAALSSVQGTLVTVQPDGTETVKAVTIVGPADQAAPDGPIVHHCAGLDWNRRSAS